MLELPAHLNCVPINFDNSKSTSGSTASSPKSSDHLTVPEGGTAGESWVALCAQAAVEQDPRRLLELVKQINFLLDARRQRLLHETDKHLAAKGQPNQVKVDGRDYEQK